MHDIFCSHLCSGIARLCCDTWRHVRSQALTYLQRALLMHDLQTLSATEWENCFKKVVSYMSTLIQRAITTCLFKCSHSQILTFYFLYFLVFIFIDNIHLSFSIATEICTLFNGSSIIWISYTLSRSLTQSDVNHVGYYPAQLLSWECQSLGDCP